MSETLVRLECSFWISVYLFGAEVTKFKVRVSLNFLKIRLKPVHQVTTQRIITNWEQVGCIFKILYSSDRFSGRV